jgi:hypothetical protein
MIAIQYIQRSFHLNDVLEIILPNYLNVDELSSKKGFFSTISLLLLYIFAIII